jgi:hypothetical protein
MCESENGIFDLFEIAGSILQGNGIDAIAKHNREGAKAQRDTKGHKDLSLRILAGFAPLR